MLYITNAFSIQMLAPSATDRATLSFKPVTLEQAIKMVETNIFVSAIGHKDTANVVSNLFKKEIPMNRISVNLGNNDVLLVAQLSGGRLPEGTTTIPDGMSIQFWVVANTDIKIGPCGLITSNIQCINTCGECDGNGWCQGGEEYIF